MKKIHLRNTTAHSADYSGSPHILKAIEMGTLTACRIVSSVDHVTRDLGLVTCVDCREEGMQQYTCPSCSHVGAHPAKAEPPTCMWRECDTVMLPSTNGVLDPVRVDYEEVMDIKARRKRINSLPFDRIAWYKGGKPMEVDPVKAENFRFIGLSNLDFLTFEIVSDTTANGVHVQGVKI